MGLKIDFAVFITISLVHYLRSKGYFVLHLTYFCFLRGLQVMLIMCKLLSLLTLEYSLLKNILQIAMTISMNLENLNCNALFYSSIAPGTIETPLLLKVLPKETIAKLESCHVS
jgi:hypothetical protein